MTPGRAPPRRGHRRRAAARDQRGRLPRRAAGLRRRRRHGRPRERRRGQPDRGRGVRPAGRRGLRARPGAPRWSRATLEASQRPDHASTPPRARRRVARVRPAPPWSRRCWSRTTGRRPGCWPTSATPGSTRSADGSLRQVSTDHSVVQELVDSGQITEAQAAEHPERHVITRALGGPRLEPADYFLLPVADGASGCCCAPTASAGWSTTTEIAAILTAEPRPARRGRPAGRGRPRGRGRRQRHRRRGRCGGIGPRPGLRLRAAARESRAETGGTAVTHR